MKYLRRLSFLLAVLIALINCIPFTALADETSTAVSVKPDITSGNAAVVYCIDNQQILYSNRMNEVVEPAVAAKLVACMVVSDLLKERDTTSANVKVTISQTVLSQVNACYADPADRIFIDFRMPIMGFGADEEYTTKDLLSATLVAGANDAVIALACHYGEVFLNGDINTFVERMNKKVKDLGLSKTHFTNPTGLSQAGQKTTPYEVTLITEAFYKYNELVTLSNVESFSLSGKTTVRNKNFLKNNYYIDGYLNKNAIGLIAGQPNADKDYCLITATQKDGLTYIITVMCAGGILVENNDGLVRYSLSENNAYADAEALLNWSRSSFRYNVIAPGDLPIAELRVNHGDISDHIMVYPEAEIKKLIPDMENIQVIQGDVDYYEYSCEACGYLSDNQELKCPECENGSFKQLVYSKEFNEKNYPTVDAPVLPGQVVGRVTYYYTLGEETPVEIVTVNAIVKDGSEVNEGLKLLDNVGNFLTGTFMKTVLIILASVIGLYVLVSIIMGITRKVKKHKNKKKNKAKNMPAVKKNKKNSDQTSNQNNSATREFD